MNRYKFSTNIVGLAICCTIFCNNFYKFAPCNQLFDNMAMKSNFFKNILCDDSVGDGGFYFGDKSTPADADVVIVSAPWSVTSDFGRGATYTPDAVIDASAEGNLYDAATAISVEGRIATAEIDYNIQESSEHLGREAERLASHSIAVDSLGGEYAARKIAHINEGFDEMHASIYRQCGNWASKGKRVAVVGGDHSVSFGAVKALAEYHKGIGVLFIDAHADYAHDEIYNYSHRSIARDMVEEISFVERLVEVGVRDIDKAEADALAANEKVELFLAERLAARRFEGESWGSLCREMVERLPHKVYVSFDVDALKIEFCNNTNAPVPGGMTFDEVIYLVNTIVESGREIVGFDISEVVSKLDNKMDAIVAARVLAKLSVAAMRSIDNTK